MKRPETPADLMPHLLQLAPGFAKQWQEHLVGYWDGEPAGIYNDTSEYCAYVINCFGAGDTTWFPDLFGLIEDLLESGSAELCGIARLGLLETRQVQASHQPHGEDVFREWLGPFSQEAWIQIRAQWNQHGSLMNIVRSERRD